MSLAYGLGDSLTHMGYATVASKGGMALPFALILVFLIARREMFDQHVLYRTSLLLMILGILSYALPSVSDVLPQLMMSAAQAAFAIVAYSMACVSARGRHESAVFGCGIMRAVALIFTQVGMQIGVAVVAGLSGTAPGTAVDEGWPPIVITAACCVIIAALVMHREDLASLVENAPKESGANTWNASSATLGARPSTQGAGCSSLAGQTSSSTREMVSSRDDAHPSAVPVADEHLLESIAARAKLSRRETAVFFRLARGESTSQISDGLFIAQGTVRVHESHIYQKLGVHSHNELDLLVRRAMRREHGPLDE